MTHLSFVPKIKQHQQVILKYHIEDRVKSYCAKFSVMLDFMRMHMSLKI